MTDRINFIKDLFTQLKNHQYVLLKHIDFSIEEISEFSDLDFLVSKETFESVLASVKSCPSVKKVNMKRQSVMNQAFIFFRDDSYLQLDFLFGFYRKGITYLKKEEIFKFSERNDEGIQVCNNRHLFEHLLLFNFLNFAGIPKKYIQYFNSQAPEEANNILDYIKTKYSLSIKSFVDLEKFDDDLRKKLIDYLSQKKQNRSFSLFKNKINYSADTLRNIFTNRGFIMTFSGVDGAGKSTIIENIKTILERKYRRNVVVLRHRPSVLPILSALQHGKQKAEKKATETLPRQGENKSKLSSFLRFCYYYSDYLLGQFYIKSKYVWRGYIVIYDRYYFDFIVDSKRSNIEISQSIPKFLYRFVSHPALNLFLYANPETILKRKKELDVKSIDELTSNYKSLFESLNEKGACEKYLPIENIDKEITVRKILEQYETMV